VQLSVAARSISAVREMVGFIVTSCIRLCGRVIGYVIFDRDNAGEGKSQQAFGRRRFVSSFGGMGKNSGQTAV
jgi:hypothetical protein